MFDALEGVLAFKPSLKSQSKRCTATKESGCCVTNYSNYPKLTASLQGVSEK